MSENLILKVRSCWRSSDAKLLLFILPRWFVGNSLRRQTPREALHTRIIQQQQAAMMVRSANIYLSTPAAARLMSGLPVCLFVCLFFQARRRVVFCTTSICCWSTTARCSARESSSSTCGRCQWRARRAAAASTRTSSPQPPTRTRPPPWPSPFYWTSTATPWCCPRAATWAGTAGPGARKRRPGSEVRERCRTTWRNSSPLSWRLTRCTHSALRTKSCCGTSGTSVCATPGTAVSAKVEELIELALQDISSPVSLCLPLFRAYPKLLGSVRWGKQEDVLEMHRLLERSSAWDSR